MIVYKYLAPERLKVLQNASIRFTQADALNDPFELRPLFSALVTEEELRAEAASNPPDFRPSLRRQYAQLSPSIRSQVTYEQFERETLRTLRSEEGLAFIDEQLGVAATEANRLAAVMRAAMRQRFGADVGILSLSEIRDSAPMWAHYASQHAGFVVGFDSSHGYFNRQRTPVDEFYHLREVIYRPLVVASSLRDLPRDFLIAKSEEWAYEREWRILAPTADAHESLDVGPETVHLFLFPPEAVVEIIVGERSDPGLRQALRALVENDARYAHVKLLEAFADDTAGRISVVPVGSR